MPPKREITPIAKRLGARLKSLRSRLGLTQKQVAEALGVDHRTVSAYEAGRATINSTEFEKWAEALGISVPELTHSLGLGLPAESGPILQSLAGKLRPDVATRMDRVVDDLAGLSEDEQDELVRAIQDQVTGRRWRSEQSRRND